MRQSNHECNKLSWGPQVEGGSILKHEADSVLKQGVVDQLLGEEEWMCGIQTSWISHLVALVTLDIPGRYVTGHYNNTTHTDTCLFPKVHMTMSFYHLSLQRYYSVQVTIIFYKRKLDYIDIYNMGGINQRGWKSEELCFSPAQLCEPGEVVHHLWVSVCSFVTCGGEPTATSTPTPVYLLPVLKGIPTWKLPVEM